MTVAQLIDVLRKHDPCALVLVDGGQLNSLVIGSESDIVHGWGKIVDSEAAIKKFSRAELEEYLTEHTIDLRMALIYRLVHTLDPAELAARLMCYTSEALNESFGASNVDIRVEDA